MRLLLAALLVTAVPLPAAAGESPSSTSPAAVAPDQRQEAGYSLEGNTLHFPRGGTHEIRDADQQTAEALLRETYGLIGPRDALVRTRWATGPS